MPKKYSEFLLSCRVISKNKLEKTELFDDIYQIVNIETQFLQKLLMGPACFFHTMLWNNLGYLMFRKIFRNFIRCRVISKNKLEKIELFGDVYQIAKMETPFLQN